MKLFKKISENTKNHIYSGLSALAFMIGAINVMQTINLTVVVASGTALVATPAIVAMVGLSACLFMGCGVLAYKKTGGINKNFKGGTALAVGLGSLVVADVIGHWAHKHKPISHGQVQLKTSLSQDFKKMANAERTPLSAKATLVALAGGKNEIVLKV